MAEIFVRHTLNPHKTVKLNLNLREYVLAGTSAGDSKWLLEVGTTALTSSGIAVVPKFINGVGKKNLDLEITNVVADICSELDWHDFVEDKYAPYINEFSPQGDNTYIKTAINFSVVDDDPSSGIDLSGIAVTFNNGEADFDITSEITYKGDPYNYNLTWLPPNVNG